MAYEKPLEIKVDSSVFEALPEKKILTKPDPVHKHWVYDELAAFKQSFVPVVHQSTGRITEEEKKILQEDIFNAKKLDQAIEVKHWALLLRIVLNLPEERAGQLLDMYVFSLASGTLIVGYGDGTFRPERMLTYGEALALAVRIIEKYY